MDVIQAEVAVALTTTFTFIQYLRQLSRMRATGLLVANWLAIVSPFSLTMRDCKWCSHVVPGEERVITNFKNRPGQVRPGQAMEKF